MKTVLITGASSGIGKATAHRLLDEGYRVYVAARRLEKMQDLAGRGATALGMDITEDGQIRAVVDRIASEAGGVDILVNNAGFGLYGAVEDTRLEDARYQFEVNLFGLARLTQLVLPHMREQRSGRIVNVSSIGGRVFLPLGAWYIGTKHALEGWSDCLRIEVAPLGIDVVLIEPGAIRTEFGEVMTPPMMERSGQGPYAELAQAFVRAMQRSHDRRAGSQPEVIAAVIAKALSARKPHRRYAAGKFARTSLFVRKWLGDAVYEFGLRRMAG